jgi:tetratricopeptide (TPR) repeat protein
MHMVFAGNAYNDFGKIDKALPDLNKAIELDPDNLFAYSSPGKSF